MTNKIRLADIGTLFQAQIIEDDAAVDVSSATAIELIFVAPDGTETTKTATFTTDGTDGYIEYRSTAGVIDQIGNWVYYAKITFSPTQVYHSITEIAFEVLA